MTDQHRVERTPAATAVTRSTRIGPMWLIGDDESWEPPRPSYWRWECGRCNTSGTSFHSLTRAEEILIAHLEDHNA